MRRPRPARKLLKCSCVAVCLLLLALSLAGCGGGGGGSTTGGGTGDTPPPPANAAPVVASIAPASFTTADVGTKVTINGTGFTSSSVVTWNGVTHASTYISATQIQLTLTASDVASTGTVQITVNNPGTGGGTATPIAVKVLAPAATITSLDPSSIVPGSGAVEITVSGSAFSTASMVQVNGSPRVTAYVGPNILSVFLTAADTASPTTLLLTVTAQGAATSAPAKLVVAQYTTPTIADTAPNYIPVGSLDTLVEIDGTGFTGETVVQVNGSQLTPLVWDSTQVLFQIPAATLTAQGMLSVTVSNPGPLVSNKVSITIGPNLVPVVTSVGPNATALGGPAFSLMVYGSNFVPSSVVYWNGSARPTTFQASNQITAAIPASDIQTLGNSIVTVTSPAPGGGTSVPSAFTTYLSITSNSMVYNPAKQLFYASIPSSAGSVMGNSVVSIDPITGNLGTPIFVGSEPNKLAVSSDGSTLWVSLDGAGAVREVNLNSNTAGTQFSLGGGEGVYNPPHTAIALAVMPGQPNTVAVVGAEEFATNNVTIFDNGVPRPNSKDPQFLCCVYVNSIAFDTTGTKLYLAGQGYGVATVDSTGITSITELNTNVNTTDLRVDSGFAYLTSGVVLNADTGAQAGVFSTAPGQNAGGPVVPDSSVGRGYVLTITQDVTLQMNAYDLSTFLPKGGFAVNGVQPYAQTLSSLYRWGQDGLAFSSGTQVFVFRSTLVRDLSTSLADMQVTSNLPSAGATGTNITYTLTAKNTGPAAATGVKLIDNLPEGVTLTGINPSQGTCAPGMVVVCDLGSLNSGASATVQVTITPLSPGTLTDTAYVSALQGDSNPANNTVTSAIAVTGSVHNAVPALMSIAPNLVQVGSPSFTLTVNGSGFAANATVNMNGSALPTTFVNPSQLTATVDQSAVASMGWVSITVTNPMPGGTSSALPLTSYLVVSLDINRFVYDPFTRKLYGTVPSSATQVAGNSLIQIDPATGAHGTPLSIGSEPNAIAESTDGKYVYVGLDGSLGLTRVDLTNLTQGPVYPLVNPNFTPPLSYAAVGLGVVPGNDNLVGVDMGGSDALLDISGSTATMRPHTTNVYSSSGIVFADANTMYSYDSYTSGREFYRWNVDSSGLTLKDTDGFTLNGDDGFSLINGIIYGYDGGVIDPTTTPPAQLGQFRDNFQPSRGVAANLASGRVFYVSQSFTNESAPSLLAYDPKRFVLVDQAQFPGSTAGLDLVRWGRDGLAWHGFSQNIIENVPGAGQIYLMRGPFVLPEWGAVNPTPSLSGASPSTAATGSGNLIVTVTGSNFVSGAVVLWNGTERETSFVDASHLSVAISAADLSHAGTATIVVNNPGSGNSSSISFAIN